MKNRIILMDIFQNNEDRIPEKILKFKLNGKHPIRKPRLRCEQQIRIDVTEKENMEGNTEDEYREV
jgi:hypothetical protein